MRRSLLAGALVIGLGACATEGAGITTLFTPKPQTPEAALDLYYNTIPDSALPVAPQGAALPGDDAVLSRILLASCIDEEQAAPALTSLAGEDADLLLLVGDNVYGDRDGPAYVSNDVELEELRESFSDLAAREDFQALRRKLPMMVAWDDHDYGANDSGREFPFKAFAERIHEVFWGLADQDVGAWPGTYYARSFGPAGQRVQVIMLDTRFFRGPLTPTDAWGAQGKERYIPAPAGSHQDMLGAVQWTWLENQLRQPADLRFIVSSVQVMPTVHGWEAWSTLPEERQRLFNLVARTDAKGVMFLSGDRHTAFLYKQNSVLPYQANEMTASSINVSFATETTEMDARQVGAGFPPENYGAVEIDWAAGVVSLLVKNGDGETVRQSDVAFSDIGIG